MRRPSVGESMAVVRKPASLPSFVSFYLLSVATKSLPIGTSYAVWTGIGAVGMAILGMVLFSESYHWLRLASILLVVGGILGLRLTAAS